MHAVIADNPGEMHAKMLSGFLGLGFLGLGLSLWILFQVLGFGFKFQGLGLQL